MYLCIFPSHLYLLLHSYEIPFQRSTGVRFIVVIIVFYQMDFEKDHCNVILYLPPIQTIRENYTYRL